VINIFDDTGKLIQQNSPRVNEGKIVINLENEAKGAYLVTLDNGVKKYSGKIIFE
jgi:hypothetical protein